MSDLAYVFNQRKNNLGIWEPVITDETVVISSTYPYTVKLLERPANGLDIASTAPPTITGYTRTENSGAIGPNEFYVNYQAGILTFHSSKAGKTVIVRYWKTGTVVSADDINAIIKRLVHMTRDPLATDTGYEIGTLWVSTTGTTTIIRRVWILTDIDATLHRAVWAPQGDVVSTLNTLGEETCVNVLKEGKIEFQVLDTLAGYFDCSNNFYLPGLGSTAGFLKNSSTGKITGGNIVVLSDLNITPSSPIYFNGVNIGHDSTSGSMHIPSGGSIGQWLQWSSDGTATWAGLTSDYTGTGAIKIEGAVISHNEETGYSHIPSGGSVGQTLVWASDGNVSWAAADSSGSVYTVSLPITLSGNTFGHSAVPGYKHVPTLGTEGQLLVNDGTSGSAMWKSINTSSTMVPNSDLEVPSQKAVKSYVDSQVSAGGPWYVGSYLSYGNTIIPRTSANNLLVGKSLIVNSSVYSGARVGLTITHDATTSTDLGIVFRSNTVECLRIYDSTASFANNVHISGNLATLRNLSYFWPTSQATGPSLLYNAGASGNLSWSLISTDATMLTSSDLTVSSQKAVKTYTDNKVAAIKYWSRTGNVVSPTTAGDIVLAPTSLKASYMTSAGLVRNNASGVLSGGAKILVSDLNNPFVLPVTNGGTGVSSISAGQMLVSVDANVLVPCSFTNLTNQVSFTLDTTDGNLFATMSLPQDIGTDSNVEFGALKVTNYVMVGGLLINPTNAVPLSSIDPDGVDGEIRIIKDVGDSSNSAAIFIKNAYGWRGVLLEEF